MTWLTENIITLLIIVGMVLLAIEVGVLGFSVFLLFFVGLACIGTALLMALGMPETVTFALGSVAVFSLVFAFALWKPLKKMQNNSIKKDVQGDFIGHSFVLDKDLAVYGHGKHRHSGVDWKVRSDVPLKSGTLVEVIKVEVGELTVAAK